MELGPQGWRERESERDPRFSIRELHCPMSEPVLIRYIYNLGPVYTMDHEVRPWKFSIVRLDGPISRSDFLKNQFTKLLGSSLGVNRMWTKRNHHAPKSECVDFL